MRSVIKLIHLAREAMVIGLWSYTAFSDRHFTVRNVNNDRWQLGRHIHTSEYSTVRIIENCALPYGIKTVAL